MWREIGNTDGGGELDEKSKIRLCAGEVPKLNDPEAISV